ncbi:MAG: cation transporter [Acetobacteraceae bacterium]|nr:cation transporter [Acetobacteraceae bacterium]
MAGPPPPGLRRAAALVAALNLGYFGVEAGLALAIGSVALFADSIDFLEDAAVNALIVVALGWSARKRAMVGALLGALILAPTVATAWTAWEKLLEPAAPPALPLLLGGVGALAVNTLCAFLIAPYRAAGGSLSRAAFLSARNDAIANAAIIAAAGLTAATLSPWPDLVVGLGILALNARAALEVWEAAHTEYRSR